MPVFDPSFAYSGAIATPQREYIPSDADEATTTRYYGFLAFNGNWLIRKLVTTTGAMTYAIGKKDYSTNWTARASLTYVRYNELFQ